MPPVRKLQLDKAAWAWSDNVDPDQITDDNIRTAYRINLPKCKVGMCRRNCRGNPYCLSGLGESKWLGNYQDDSEDDDPDLETREPNSFVGLKNLGATCYVNSLLQLWFHNLSFRRSIFRWNPMEDPVESTMIETEDGTVNSPRTVVGHLQLLFGLMQFSKRKFVDPSEFIKVLDLEPSTQQDAQEFSKLFISLLEDSLSQQSDLTVRNLINNNFKGEYSYMTRCSKCQKESVSPSQFYELELNVKGNKTLHESLTEFLREEKLEGANMYSCSTCQDKQEAARFIRLQSLPPVLNLQLMRFIYDRQKGHKKKLNSSFQFPDSLDMSIYLNNECGEKLPLIYHLTAVLIHKGPSAYSGHYIAHICDQTTGTWYKFNDECVEKMEGKKLKLGSEEDTEDGSKKVKQPRLAKGFLASSNAYMLVYTAASVEEGQSPITEADITPYVLKQVQLCNEGFDNAVENTREERKNRKANGKVHRAEMASLLNSLPVGESVDSKWEAISRKWLSYWLSNSKSVVQAVDNSKLLCIHGKLDPNSLGDAKYINTTAGETIYEKYGGGPQLIGKDVMCKECVIAKCKGIRTRTKISEDAKEILNLLKQKENLEGPGFWVGKRSLKAWRRMAIKLLMGKEELTKSNNCDTSTYISKHDSTEIFSETGHDELAMGSEKSIENPAESELSDPHSGTDIETSENMNNCNLNVSSPAHKKSKTEHSFSVSLDTITNLTNSVFNCSLQCESDCSFDSLRDLKLLCVEWDSVGLKLKELYKVREEYLNTKQSVNSHKFVSGENDEHASEPVAENVVNGNDFNSVNNCSSRNRKRKFEVDEEEKDGDSCEEGKLNGTGYARSDDDEDEDEDFNEDIVCTHGNMVHEDAARRFVTENVWAILKSYFPNAREFPRETEPCHHCQCLASEGQVAKDLYRQQAQTQKELLQGLLLGKNRPKSKSGTYHIVSVTGFLEPWRKFIREAGRREPLYSLRNSSLICVHGLLLYNPDLEEDSSKIAVVTEQEWSILSQMYAVETEITVTWNSENELVTSPRVCGECVMERLENEQKALLQYKKAKLYIRQVAVTKSSAEEGSDTNAAPASPAEASSTGPVPGNGIGKKAGGNLFKGEGEAVRRSTRHRRVRGEKEVTVSSSQTLKDLKLQILQTFNVPPYDQHLMSEDGRELVDNTATLSSLNIYPNSVILLKVDEPPEDTATPEEDFIRTTEPEAGFKGTGLMKRL